MHPAPARQLLPWLLNGWTFWVYGLAATLVFSALQFSAGITRFAPGSPLPDQRLAALVIPDPVNPGGPPRLVPIRQWQEFRRQHPTATLALPPIAAGAMRQDHWRVFYSVKASPIPDAIEVTVRTDMPDIDSLGAFQQTQFHYRVSRDRIEPLLMVTDDPFLRWIGSGVSMLFLVLLVNALLEYLLIGRPLRQGRLDFGLPLQREWLVSRGIPLRFEPAPADFAAVADALRRTGAQVDLEVGQHYGALRARIGRRAELLLNVVYQGQRAVALNGRIVGGWTPLGLLLLIFVVPIALLLAAGEVGFWLLAPLSAPMPDLPFLAVLGAVAGLAGLAGWYVTMAPGRAALGADADRLVHSLVAALAAQSSVMQRPLAWPALQSPRSAWHRRLPWILLAAIMLAVLAMVLA